MIIGLFHGAFEGWAWYFIVSLLGGLFLFLLGLLTLLISIFQKQKKEEYINILELDSLIGKLTEKQTVQKIFSQLPDKEIEDTIYSWIDRTLYTVEKQPETDHFYFGFDVTDPSKKPISIFREKVRPDQITLVSGVTMSERHKAIFQSLPRPQQESIIHQLRIEMLRFGISFQGLDFPLEKITLTDVISLDRYLDGFHLMQRAMFVRRGLGLVMERMWQMLDGEDPATIKKVK